MSKELFVSSTPHETKVAIVEDDQLTEVYFERENEYTLAGSIYKGRVTRVLPGMQSAFVNVGLERDAFLYVSDFLLQEDEEEDDGLQQAVSRSRGGVIAIEPPGEGQVAPIEAESVLPVPDDGNPGAEPERSETPGGSEGAPEPSREGARKWRGRRRRGRGRDRFQERGTERPPQREDQAPPVAASGSEEPIFEAQSEPQREPRESHEPREPREPRHEHRSDSRREPPAAHEPVILPGESLSRYQPQAPTAPVAATSPAAARPVSQYASRPSTEYAIDSAQFSAGSMTLPGESLAKYRRGDSPRRAGVEEVKPVVPAVELHHESHEHESVAAHAPVAAHKSPAEITPAVISEVHVPEQAAEVLHAEASYSVQPPVAEHTLARPAEEAPEEVVETPPAAQRFEDDEPGFARHPAEPVEIGEVQRIEHMNVASTFGGDAVESSVEAGPAEPQAAAHAEAHQDRPAFSNHETRAHQPWQSSGAGVVEEEEIEEEESDLPSFEEGLDLADYEILEEEELAPQDDQMIPLGGQLTEAVRDAHVNERATGQYEAEGLEGAEDFEEIVDALTGAGDEDDEEDGALELAEDNGDHEGAPAEAHAQGGAAGHPQRSERGGRPDRRGGRKPPRRMRGRPRGNFQRHLPAITDLLKEGQEILVQIAKEPIAKKGARITSHIALPGRFLVYMPTVHHTGVSRKIASEEDRQRLKRIVTSERGDAHGGFIVRTAAAGASEDDLRADIRFLINLWTEIRGRAETGKAPALIYHDLNLVERILRDQVTVSFSQIWVDTEHEYERILRFVSRFQPSLIKRVKLYTKETPLFEQFAISDEINKALKSKVWLKSGGYIVINQTEALVAIDVNTGKYVGKTARLEDTIVKTNIDAIKEIVRQIRLRDLGGIIVIDFIDMDERKNRHKVMQALEEALKGDRAPSKVLQFNDFGLVAITRKRVKQSLERTLGQPCTTCTGTGMIKSVTTVCNEIYVEMRKMSRHFDRDIMLRVNPEVGKTLKANGGRWLQEMEDLTKQTILVKSDPLLHPEQFDIQ